MYFVLCLLLFSQDTFHPDTSAEDNCETRWVKNVAKNLSPMLQQLSKTFKTAKLIIGILDNMHHFLLSKKSFVFGCIKILIAKSSILWYV